MLTSPASQHYYGYAYNNPVNYTDPMGLCVPFCLAPAAPVVGPPLGAAAAWGLGGLAAVMAGAAAIVRWDDISAFVGSCLEQQGQYLEESASI